MKRLLLLLLALSAPAARAQLAAPDILHATRAQIERLLHHPALGDELTPLEWQTYGEQLTALLATDHDDARQDALRLVIRYGPRLTLDPNALLAIARLYRTHDDDRLRRMDAAALGKTGDPWALDFLERWVWFERTPAVLHTVAAVIEAPVRVPLGCAALRAL